MVINPMCNPFWSLCLANGPTLKLFGVAYFFSGKVKFKLLLHGPFVELAFVWVGVVLPKSNKVAPQPVDDDDGDDGDYGYGGDDGDDGDDGANFGGGVVFFPNSSTCST